MALSVVITQKHRFVNIHQILEDTLSRFTFHLPADRTHASSPVMSSPETGGYVDPGFPNPHGSHDAQITINGYIPNRAL